MSIPKPLVPMLSTPRTAPASRRVTLNVGGMRHEVQWLTLERLPHSRLGRLRNCDSEQAIALLCDDYSLNANEYFFDRSPDTFSTILNFYRTGKLHMPQGVCIVAFCDELHYWGVHESHISMCCDNSYYSQKEGVEDDIRKHNEALRKHLEEEDFGHGKCAKKKKWLWDTLEKPKSSKLAMVVTIISTVFIIVSTAGLVVSTLPAMQVTNMNGQPKEHPTLEIMEAVCIAWFTFEFIARFLSAPDKRQFIRGSLNIIDFISIVPYYVLIILLAFVDANDNTANSRVVQVFRILRVCRILKLGRNSKGLQALGFTLARSYRELALLVFFLAIGVLIFSSLEFFVEKQEPETTFTSIPASFWWAAITMTTVGYGDMTPTSPLGKLISAACCICGVLFIALPIPLIVNNFTKYHQIQIKIDKSLKRYDDQEEKKSMKRILDSGSKTSHTESTSKPQ